MYRAKILTLLIFIMVLLFVCNPVWAAPVPPQITADSAILMDIQTGQILFEKNAFEKRPPASTTKILTALLALEGGDLNQLVTVSPRAAATGESSIHLQAGEKLTLEELIYGALIESGNDACVAIAEHIAGKEENFVQLMNHKAKLLGAINTNFVNTNGLPAKDHYSSAYDLAILTRHALHNPVFNNIVSTHEKIISGPGWNRYLHNTNRLLETYDGADGVKTGTTDAAGQCLVASATKDNRRLVCVVLHSEDRYFDSTTLLEYGFNNFEYVEVAVKGQPFGKIRVKEGTTPEVSVVAQSDLGAVIPRKHPELIEKKVVMAKELIAPVADEQITGQVELFVSGNRVGTTKLITLQQVSRLPDYKILLKRLIK
ncbi:D-alanyl-D-alanine carboxypeptidase family protein [Desulfolucanica intricata]|uniref:D-alanyl-D-alanine carboxypeptidase family protein n=1 Tax=Desulfolucanica intricata TaxID=1285191 RepID=UPI00082AF716|nr:D-alanyl-D-alanine carboxypeptidase family protein [Desulfolucanica intricata]